MYIDAEKLKEHISRLRDEFIKKSETKGYTTLEYRHKAEGLSLALQHIDSLQQEQSNMDLEEEIDKQIDKCWDDYAATQGFDWKGFARHFYERGLNARKEE